MFRLQDGEDDAGEAAEEQAETPTRPAEPGQGSARRISLSGAEFFLGGKFNLSGSSDKYRENLFKLCLSELAF